MIVLTSSENPDDERRSLALGAAQFFRKPADLDSLAHVVEGIVKAHLGQAVSQFEFGESWPDEPLRQRDPENSATP